MNKPEYFIHPLWGSGKREAIARMRVQLEAEIARMNRMQERLNGCVKTGWNG